MSQKLINYFLKFVDLTQDERAVLSASMELNNFPKGTYLIKEGDYNQQTYFILEGCVRQFKLVDGEEFTTNFFTEEQWIISMQDGERKPSEIYLICMEDTSVVVGNDQKAQNIFKKFPRLETTARKILEQELIRQHQLFASYITDKPEQRYLKLLTARPELFHRVPQYDIASYLGVKPESLSRIRKKITRRK